MTTIAYCGKYLAVDSQLTSGNTKFFTNKLMKHKKGWYAVAGNFRDYLGYGQMLDGKRPDKISNKSVCVWSDGKSVYSQEGPGPKIKVKAPYADGSGTNAAMAAMMMGADARQAVKIASKLDTTTGGRVNSVRIQR